MRLPVVGSRRCAATGSWRSRCSKWAARPSCWTASGRCSASSTEGSRTPTWPSSRWPVHGAVWLGRSDECLAHLEPALTAAAGLELDRVQAQGGSLRGLYLASIGRFGESLAMQGWALEAARRSGDLAAEYHVRGNIDDHLIQSDRLEAEGSTLETLELTRRLGDRSGSRSCCRTSASGGCTRAAGTRRSPTRCGRPRWGSSTTPTCGPGPGSCSSYLYRGHNKRAGPRPFWCRSCAISTTASSARSASLPRPWSRGSTAISTTPSPTRWAPPPRPRTR